jgi:hypothetical protein
MGSASIQEFIKGQGSAWRSLHAFGIDVSVVGILGEVCRQRGAGFGCGSGFGAERAGIDVSARHGEAD